MKSGVRTTKYTRRPFEIEAVIVTENNLSEVAEWCHGIVEIDETTHHKHFIRVKVVRPANDRQTTAYPGDYVLKYGRNFKVYTADAFRQNFVGAAVEIGEDFNYGAHIEAAFERAFDDVLAARSHTLLADRVTEKVEAILAEGVVVFSNPNSVDRNEMIAKLREELIADVIRGLSYGVNK